MTTAVLSSGQLVALLERKMAEKGLSRHALAEALHLPYSTVKGWLSRGPSKTRPSKHNLQRISDFLAVSVPAAPDKKLRKEAERHTQKLRWLLLLLEDELRWFRDGTPEARSVFHERLNEFDVGYVTSLLTMLGEEEKFQRWRVLTTNRFRGFREGG